MESALSSSPSLSKRGDGSAVVGVSERYRVRTVGRSPPARLGGRPGSISRHGADGGAPRGLLLTSLTPWSPLPAWGEGKHRGLGGAMGGGARAAAAEAGLRCAAGGRGKDNRRLRPGPLAALLRWPFLGRFSAA